MKMMATRRHEQSFCCTKVDMHTPHKKAIHALALGKWQKTCGKHLYGLTCAQETDQSMKIQNAGIFDEL
ncbi:UNVERIFIED_CONTAM: hypothetical protein K2H54_057012 [Gekko kuhli]